MSKGRREGLRILALVTDAFGGYGGIARYNQDLLGALAASSEVSDIVVLPRHGGCSSNELPKKVSQTRPKAGRLAFASNALFQAISRGPFDIVFCGHIYMSPLAEVASKILKRPMWLQLHGIDAWDPLGPLVRGASESARLITVVSRYTRHRFLEWADVLPERVRVLPNTFAPAFAAGAKPYRLIDRLDLRGRKVILTVSRLEASAYRKGHDRVIAALPKIRERIPEIVYVVVGDGDERQRLEALAHNAGVADAVHFAGRVSAESLPDYFRLADCFVMPGTGEGFGIVYLEAAACGLPVIAGNRDGSIDALADGAIGALVDPENASQLIDAVCSSLEDLGPKTCATSHERFAVSNFRRHVDELLQSF